MISLTLDHRVAAGQQFNLLQISLVVGVWFPGPRIHISGSHRPSGDLGPSPCPLWSFRGAAAARTRAPPSTLPLSVGRHQYNYSNVWFTNYKTEKCVGTGQWLHGSQEGPEDRLVMQQCAVCKCHPPPGDRWNIQWNMNPILMLNGLLTTPLSMRCCTGLSPFRISLWNMDAICFLNMCVIH